MQWHQNKMVKIKQMLQYDRFETILNKLQTQSSVRVTELSKELGASESTIRRDIAELDKEGRLRKVFGGAVALEAKRPGNGTKNSPECGGKRIASGSRTRCGVTVSRELSSGSR